jgi:hypothetical protein
MDSDKVAAAERELDKCFDVFRKLGGSNPVGQRNGAEARYGDAYQLLVRLGARSQLKLKYRRA